MYFVCDKEGGSSVHPVVLARVLSRGVHDRLAFISRPWCDRLDRDNLPFILQRASLYFFCCRSDWYLECSPDHAQRRRNMSWTGFFFSFKERKAWSERRIPMISSSIVPALLTSLAAMAFLEKEISGLEKGLSTVVTQGGQQGGFCQKVELKIAAHAKKRSG